MNKIAIPIGLVALLAGTIFAAGQIFTTAKEARQKVQKIEIEVEEVGEEVVPEDGEIIIESEPVCESCGAVIAKTEEETKEAGTEAEEMTVEASGDEFVKYAKISPKNRKKLRDYWKNMLNYAPDFVDLMVKDYE